MKTKIVSCHTADSKPDKQEVNGTVILPPLVFTGTAKGASPSHSGKYLTFHKNAVEKHSSLFRLIVSGEKNVLLD
jgi:hypothetical protein